MLWQSGWFWAILGIALGIAETLLPGFILLGFGIGALLTAVGLWIGLIGGSLPVVLLVWAVASAFGWFALKKLFTRPEDRPKIWKKDINDNS
jgi:membrane protein implicated in regulation of membrane protease activity